MNLREIETWLDWVENHPDEIGRDGVMVCRACSGAGSRGRNLCMSCMGTGVVNEGGLGFMVFNRDQQVGCFVYCLSCGWVQEGARP